MVGDDVGYFDQRDEYGEVWRAAAISCREVAEERSPKDGVSPQRMRRKRKREGGRREGHGPVLKVCGSLVGRDHLSRIAGKGGRTLRVAEE